MIVDELGYLEHHGVKGQKWGRRQERRVARVQKRVDRISRVADGTASGKDRLLAANRYTFTQKGAKRQLQRGANNQAKVQAKIDAGKMHVRMKILDKLGVVKVTDINYHVKGDAKAKLDNGQKAALGFLAAVGTLQVVRIAGHVANAANRA